MDSLHISHTSTGNVPELESRPQDADREDAATVEKFNKLRAWLEHERDRQAENRAEMAIDADYYDGLQWTEEDAREIEARGQAPLVFNEIKVSIDWILGAEKRNRVDWRVLPREASDQQGAVVRSKVLKYLSDANRTPFTRSQAFSEAVTSGLSFIEDGLSMDATEDVLYSGHESWRNVLHDSYHKRADGKDMRYLFRWRYLDLDIAKALWPKHADAFERMALGAEQLTADADDELWYLGANLRDPQTHRSSATRSLSMTGSSVGSDRRRVKVYEAWYREPTSAKVLYGGAYHGDILNEKLPAHKRAVASGQCDAIPAIVLRMRVAFMTDAELLEDCESPFAHNGFPLTPIYAFRRGRDGMPYGYIRQMRDPQMDLNKRMSKSLFLLSVNQLITERGAFSSEKDGYTLADAIDNISNPQGVFILERGDARFEIRRDFQEIKGHADILALDRMFLQSVSGVNPEQLGRTTNVISGKGILAKQEQGALTTAGIFDNYRLAIATSGQKALSNVEKFYSMPKIIRLTEMEAGSQGPRLDWVEINQPEIQPDGSVRFLNDITDSHADFIVDEQDYRASMRQAMFDHLIEVLKVVAPIAPTIAVGLLDLVIDAEDFPGKEAVVDRIRQLIAEARGELKTPEQKAAEAAAMAMQMQAAAAKIAKDEASADKTDAEADQIRAGLNAGMIAVDLERTAQGDAPMAPAAGAGSAGQSPRPASPDRAAGASSDPMQAILAELQQMRAEHRALAEKVAATQAPRPRSKVIRMTGPDGREITATVEHRH